MVKQVRLHGGRRNLRGKRKGEPQVVLSRAMIVRQTILFPCINLHR